MRSDLDVEVAAIRASAAASVASERAAADARRHAELEEAETRRAAQVETLHEAHAAALAEVKLFYDTASAEQLGTIRRLKDELAAVRTREAALEAQVSDLTQRCSSLGGELTEAQQELKILRPLAMETEKSKASAASAIARAAKCEKQLTNVSYELEVKTQLAAALKTERDALEKALDVAEVTSRRPGRILSAVSLSST